ncbi:unnamed protein product [Effrenium voratum]|nr:unnamed protein product [Effrenium voratum]
MDRGPSMPQAPEQLLRNTNLKDNPGPGTYDHEAPEMPLPRRLPGGTGGGGPALDPPGFGSDSPQTSTTFSSSRLPAVFFSSSWSPALLPGPGTYDLKSGDGKQSSSAFRSTSDRFWVPEGGARPGPGQYTQPSDLPTEKIRRARSVPDFMGRKFFGVQNPHQLRSLRETDGLMLGNWGHGPQRPSPASNRNVAPGSYNPEECMGQSISAKLRHLAKMAQGAAFGGSRYGERFQSSGIESVSPGPVLPHEEVTKAGDASGGAFKSGAPRLASPRSEEELPGPGSYDVVGKPDFRAGWRIAKRDHVSFNSSGQRFENNATDVPPPGAYELTSEEGKGCYSFKATATRGVAAPKGHHGPDPGMYNIAGSLLRKSFNTKVEETAWLLQTPSDKNRPPPRGPFPWAEGSTWRPRQVLEALALEDKTATEATERVLLQPEKSA